MYVTLCCHIHNLFQWGIFTFRLYVDRTLQSISTVFHLPMLQTFVLNPDIRLYFPQIEQRQKEVPLMHFAANAVELSEMSLAQMRGSSPLVGPNKSPRIRGRGKD